MNVRASVVFLFVAFSVVAIESVVAQGDIGQLPPRITKKTRGGNQMDQESTHNGNPPGG